MPRWRIDTLYIREFAVSTTSNFGATRYASRTQPYLNIQPCIAVRISHRHGLYFYHRLPRYLTHTRLKELSKISDNIKNHVQSYYHLQPAGGNPNAHLATLTAPTGFDGVLVADVLMNISTRADAMRLFIAWTLFSKCEGGRRPALLPSQIGPMLESISTRGATGTGEHTPVVQCGRC
jgi:hypothetical protein